MAATILGYTQGKLEKKAEKRDISTKAYLLYLQLRNNRKRSRKAK